MILRNLSRYPDAEVRRIVRFATARHDMRKVCVKVKNASTRAFRGRAYDHIPGLANVPASARYLVTIGIGPASCFPELGHRYLNRTDRFPTYDMHDWREALVVVAAHEAVHIEQFRERLRASELKAERYAVRRLNEWREKT